MTPAMPRYSGEDNDIDGSYFNNIQTVSQCVTKHSDTCSF